MLVYVYKVAYIPVSRIVSITRISEHIKNTETLRKVPSCAYLVVYFNNVYINIRCEKAEKRQISICTTGDERC